MEKWCTMEKENILVFEYHWIKGHFENGRRHGEGVFKYLNGDYYSGWFKYGKKCG